MSDLCTCNTGLLSDVSFIRIEVKIRWNTHIPRATAILALDSDQHSLRHSVLIKWNWTERPLE
jgi:hypothetical protein